MARTRERRIAYDLYLGGEQVRRDVAAADGPPHPEQLLFGNRWIVTAVLPATDPRIDYEVFARPVAPDEVLRPLRTYLVVKRGTRPGTASYATRQPLSIGTEIVLDVEKWVVREIHPRRNFRLLDGVLVVERR